METTDSEALSAELGEADFGDRRLSRRLGRIVDALIADPSKSFPKIAESEADLEATYRFLRNEAVTPEAILACHYEATAERASHNAVTLVAHDTTTFSFPGEARREGLGRLRSEKGQGFFGHFSLALRADGSREPLGVLNLQTLFREKKKKGKRSRCALREDPMNESRRWTKGVDETEVRVAGRSSAVHLMDREGDAYRLLSELIGSGRRFVIRAAHDRSLTTATQSRAKEKVSDALGQAVDVVEREVALSRRKSGLTPKSRKIHPKRSHRMARLAFRATAVELVRPTRETSTVPSSLKLNVVHVHEEGAPLGEEPVRWTLFTTEPIDDAATILRIVDWYRARWVIEEYFKALKQGCAYEARQLESRETLLVALAIFVPMAWRLLRLRSAARHNPDLPATTVLTKSQVEVLVATSRRNLPANPSVREAMLDIAARGGHIRNNGSPGWLVLARGFHDLLLLDAGWRAAKGDVDTVNCDQ